MKIAFVNIRKDMYPPLGACYLSGYLKSKMPDIETSLIELLAGESRKNAVKKILKAAADIVGFTSYTVGLFEIISLCAELKKARPELALCVGGPHITSLPHTLPASIDIGVIGEGEQTLHDLCKIWSSRGKFVPEDLFSLPGICYRRGAEVYLNPGREQIEPLDLIPPPDLSLLDMGWYTKTKRLFVMKADLKGFTLLTSRGCPYSCRFCQAVRQWGSCRYHSAGRIVSEIERLRNRYPLINAINIIDDLFIANRARLIETVQLIKNKNLHQGIVFNVNGRANLIDAEVLGLLKSINVIQISYGFESGSERVLHFLKNGSVKLSHNQMAADLTNNYGIGVGGQFMIGALDETEEEINKTINFIRNNKMSHAHLSVTTPLPGTELWEIYKERGYVSEEMDWRKLDFGNPYNPHLMYANECVPKDRFGYLVRLAQSACGIWNPKPDLRTCIFLLETISPGELIRRLFARIFFFIKKTKSL